METSGVGSIASFTLTAILIELTPGPNMTYLALLSASEGRRAGFAAVAGVALGLAIVGVVAALGVAEIIYASTLAYEGLRWAGVLFLLYLAWEGWRGEGDVADARSAGSGRYFLRGVMTNLLNPKAAVFYVAMLPSFVTPGGDLRTQTLTLTAIYVGIATAIHVAIVTAAGALEAWLNDPARERIARRVLSALLAGVAIWFGRSTAR